jgi:hypothetical protein
MQGLMRFHLLIARIVVPLFRAGDLACQWSDLQLRNSIGLEPISPLSHLKREKAPRQHDIEF